MWDEEWLLYYCDDYGLFNEIYAVSNVIVVLSASETIEQSNEKEFKHGTKGASDLILQVSNTEAQKDQSIALTNYARSDHPSGRHAAGGSQNYDQGNPKGYNTNKGKRQYVGRWNVVTIVQASNGTNETQHKKNLECWHWRWKREEENEKRGWERTGRKNQCDESSFELQYCSITGCSQLALSGVRSCLTVLYKWWLERRRYHMTGEYCRRDAE